MRRISPLVVTLAILATVPAAVLAHGGNARVEVGPAAVPAGGSVTVRGVELGADESVELTLVAADGRTTVLGSVIADAEGAFSQVLVLPADAAEGAASVRARLSDGDALEVALEVRPPLDEEGEQRAEEEPLLAPMPSPSARPAAAPAAATSPSAATPASTESAVSATDDPSMPAGDLAWVAAAVLALVALGVFLLRRRSA